MPKANTKQDKSPIPKKMKAMERLFAAGVRTGEQLQKMTVLDMAQIEGVTNDEARMMLAIQEHDRTGTLFDYFCEE